MSTPLAINLPTEPERWAAHPDHPLYEVSTHGRVRSWVSRGPLAVTEPRMLKQWVGTNGYASVVFVRPRRRAMSVHTAVLEAHAGPRPEGWEVRHLNGNKLDNRLENLGWGTHQQNEADKRAHGTLHIGERNGLAKLNADQVLAARKQRRAGATVTGLAMTYGVSIGTMSQALSGQTWGHLPMEMDGRLNRPHLELVR